MSKSIFYHAGCPVCVSAEQDIISLIGADNVEVVHLGNDKNKIGEAENAGVKSGGKSRHSAYLCFSNVGSRSVSQRKGAVFRSVQLSAHCETLRF